MRSKKSGALDFQYFKPKLELSIDPIVINSIHNNKVTLDTGKLDNYLSELGSKYRISKIIIKSDYIYELSEFYLDILYKLCEVYTKNIELHCDLSKVSSGMINVFQNIYVNLNFNNFRGDQRVIEDNIKALKDNRCINIISIDKSCKENPEAIISKLNRLGVNSWKIIPHYLDNKENIDFNSFQEYENIILKYITLAKTMKFAFINKLELDNVINNYNYSLIRLKINASGNILFAKYDDKDNLYFQEFDDLLDVYKELEIYDQKIKTYCNYCPFKNKCLATYINYNWKLDSCSGSGHLLRHMHFYR